MSDHHITLLFIYQFGLCGMQILLAHEHADAVLGLDVIRALQAYSATNDIDRTPVYLTQFATERYLFYFWLFFFFKF